MLTDRPGQLTNDFFANLLDMGTGGPRSAKPKTSSKVAIAPTATRSGRPHESTWCLVPTASCVRIAEEYAAAGGEDEMFRPLCLWLGQGHGERSLRPHPDVRLRRPSAGVPR